MRHIDKTNTIEPPSLTNWKRYNPADTYRNITDEVRRDIREQALKEQYYLCAHCCYTITTIDNCHNEHIESQHSAGNLTLEYQNIVASCNRKKQCGDSHKAQLLSLTPLMPECETELRFMLSGRVEGLTARAKQTIDILNLGRTELSNKSLVKARKQLVDIIFFREGFDVDSGFQLEDQDLLNLLIDDLTQPKDGRLEAFAPVAVNILRQWLGANNS